MNDKDYETLAAVIYNTVQTKLAVKPIAPFVLAAQTVRAAYIQAARDAAVFVGNAILRRPAEREVESGVPQGMPGEEPRQ